MAETPLLTSLQRGRLRIVLGVVCVVLGFAAIVWPGATLLVVAFLFGLELIAAGVVRITSAAMLKTFPRWWRALSAVLGALTLIAGVVCLVRPGASLIILLTIIAVGWLLDGASELVSAFAVSRQPSERIGLIAFGLLSVIAAIVLLALPGASLIALARAGGAILIVFGIVSIIIALGKPTTQATTSTAG
jgi:uncharacterized membrane protein HdeD (DUF308 family)